MSICDRDVRIIYGAPPWPRPRSFEIYDKLGPCVHCGELASKHGGVGDHSVKPGWCPNGNGGWGYTEWEGAPAVPMKLVEELEKIAEEPENLPEPAKLPGSWPKKNYTPGCVHCEMSLRPPYRPCDAHETKVDAPPPYATSPELALIKALESLAELDSRAVVRVLRYAVSRWGHLDPPTIVRGTD